MPRPCVKRKKKKKKKRKEKTEDRKKREKENKKEKAKKTQKELEALRDAEQRKNFGIKVERVLHTVVPAIQDLREGAQRRIYENAIVRDDFLRTLVLELFFFFFFFFNGKDGFINQG